MAVRRSTHVTLAALAALLLLIGVYAIVRVADSSASGSQGSATGDTAGPTGSTDSTGSASPSGGSGSVGGRQGGTGGGSKAPGAVEISGPTVDNVFPQNPRDSAGRYLADICLVLSNENAGFPVRIRSYSVEGAGAQIAESCGGMSAKGAVWNDGGVTDPVNTCAAGSLLEPKSQSPRHVCSLRISRPAGLGAGTATLYVKVTADCTPSSPSPCPSSTHPVTAIITTAIAFEFAADPSASGSGGDTSGTTSPPPGGETGDAGETSGTPSATSAGGDAGGDTSGLSGT